RGGCRVSATTTGLRSPLRCRRRRRPTASSVARRTLTKHFPDADIHAPPRRRPATRETSRGSPGITGHGSRVTGHGSRVTGPVRRRRAHRAGRRASHLPAGRPPPAGRVTGPGRVSAPGKCFVSAPRATLEAQSASPAPATERCETSRPGRARQMLMQTTDPAGADDLSGLSVAELARATKREAEKFQRGEPSQDAFGVELFRRGVWYRDTAAWEAVGAQYRGLLLTWIKRHPASPLVHEDDDYWIHQAFTRFWQAVYTERIHHFATLAALLSYLRMCTHSVLMD